MRSRRRPWRCGQRWRHPGLITDQSACTTRCGRWGWMRSHPQRRWRESSERRAWRAVSRRRSPAARGDDLSIPLRTHAGSSMAPSTCWPADARRKEQRFHQTLFRYLDKQPLADNVAELQAQVDAFRPRLQHRAATPGPPRAGHTTDCMVHYTESRSTTPRSQIHCAPV